MYMCVRVYNVCVFVIDRTPTLAVIFEANPGFDECDVIGPDKINTAPRTKRSYKVNSAIPSVYNVNVYTMLICLQYCRVSYVNEPIRLMALQC